MADLPTAAALHIHYAALSDQGKVRTNNEDSLVADAELGLYAVADGMGGHAAGEIASRMAVEMLREATLRAPDRDYLQSPTAQNRRALLDWLARTVASINSAIFERAQQDARLRGMGCTLDVALVRGTGLFMAHVGDSRIYALRGGTLYQMTEDHSLGQALLASGAMSAEEVARHPQRSTLTRALGPMAVVQVDTSFLELQGRDLFLLCSDGLHGEVPPEHIRALLAEAPERAAPALVQAALDGGGRDNVTVVVLSVDSCPHGQQAVIGSEAARAALLRSPLFAALTEAELLRVQKIASAREVQAGETIVALEQLADTLYVAVEGTCVVERDGERLDVLAPGDPFGTHTLMEATSEVEVRAQTAARLLCFPLSEIRDLFTSEPAITAKLARGALERTAQRLARTAAMLARYRRAARELAALGALDGREP